MKLSLFLDLWYISISISVHQALFLFICKQAVICYSRCLCAGKQRLCYLCMCAYIYVCVIVYIGICLCNFVYSYMYLLVCV